MAFKDKFIFRVVPNPTQANSSKIEWRGFLDDVSQDIVIFDDDTGAILFRIGSGGGVLPVTYDQLLTLQAAGGLIQGRQYLITNFRTKYNMPNTAVVNTGPVEPLIVTAANANQIAPEAISVTNPQDQILYELTDSTTSGGDRGRIYSRKDTLISVSAGYDWRVVQFRRWDDGFGNFTALTDNGNAFADSYTFNNSNIAAGCEETSLGPITNFGIATFGAPPSKLNNFVFNASICLDNIFEHDNFDSTIIGDAIGANRTQPAFFQNTAVGGQFLSNVIGVVFIQNTMGSDFSDNIIGAQNQGNQYGDSFISNHIGINSFLNTFGNNCQANILTAGFSLNVVGLDFKSNTIGIEAQGNIIGNNFNANQIGTKFQNNVIADNFTHNVISGAFISNINIQNDFRLNNVAFSLSGVDFAAATFVYADYTKDIFKNSAGNYRLSYTDGADVIQYAAPNA